MRMKFEDLTGQRFGKWIVVRYHDKRSANYRWLCRCDCDAEHVVWQHSLLRGRSTRCKRCVPGRHKHGHGRDHGHASPTYSSYRHMLDRCLNPNSKDWPAYGGKGIDIDPWWLGDNGFANFLADMGERPKGTTLDRIWHGDYGPGQCRWATWRQQLRNRKPRSPHSKKWAWWYCSREWLDN